MLLTLECFMHYFLKSEVIDMPDWPWNSWFWLFDAEDGE